MTSIVSAISGQFSKSLILGTLLPAALFVLLGLVFLAPLLPITLPLLKPLETLDPQWQVVVISFIIVVLAGLLYNLNIPLLRLYEGYPWKDTRIGKELTHHYQTRFNAAQARWRGMRTLLRAIRSGDSETFGKIFAHYDDIGLQVNSEFPKDERLVLPTRLGNVIRSFEDYPYRQYGMEAITLWPRLIAKIDKDYAATIDDSKSSFDFMLNSSALSAGLALALLFAGLLYPVTRSSAFWIPWLFEVVGFALFSYIFYQLAIGRAFAWGEMVKGAFDLYRWKLLKQLGFDQVPRTMVEERDLWNDIYQQMLYGDQPTIALPDYASKSVSALPTARTDRPNLPNLETARGVNETSQDGKIQITLRVHNVDLMRRTAVDVVVTDTLPEDLDYEWGSAKCAGANSAIEVVGGNPYQFRVGDLKYGESVTVTYCAIRRKK